MKLTDFANASEQDFRWLKQQIDALPPRRAYLFDDCDLISGCTPAHATIGLYQDTTRYVVYLNEDVRYIGTNDAMRALTKNGRLFFLNYPEMVRFFKAFLPRPAPPPPPVKAPESRSDGENIRSVVNMDELTLPSNAPSPPLDYRKIQRMMEESIMGQKTAVEAIAYQTAMHLNKTNPKKPLSIVTYGPPGTGKSETAKVLAQILSDHSGRKYQTVFVELNTFTEAHSVYRLIGSPPGYLGYDDTPVFETIASNPYTVFIFDELDKAHPQVLKTFMSILDEGRCSTRKELPDHSREYDFRNSLFIFTSNYQLGTSLPKQRIGFAGSDDVRVIRSRKNVIEADEHENTQEDENAAIIKRIFNNTEAARKAFVDAGVLKEIASRFNCFVEFKELNTEAKARILVKQVIETGLEYNVRIERIAPGIMQELINASVSENVLTVRSFKNVIEGYLSATFSQASSDYKGHTVQLEGTLEFPMIAPI